MEETMASTEDHPITAREIEHESRRQDLIFNARSLQRLSGALSFVFATIGTLGVFAGILIAGTKTRTDFDVFSGDATYEYRNGVVGTVIAVASFVEVGLVLIYTKAAGVIARYVRYRAEGGIF
jgi:hypothetical protein